MPSNVIQGFFPHGAGRTAPVPASLAHLPRGGGQPLPPVLQRSAEAAFGKSFADVRLYVGREAPSIGALAFTNGSNIYFAPGQYDPHSANGRRVLWHELAHVAQQKAGRVRNPFGTGMAIVHDRVLEAEAERISLRPTTVQRKAARSRVIQPLLMYTYPAGTIVNSLYSEEELEAIDKVAVKHMGVTVYADERNIAATKLEIARRMQAGSLNAIPAESDLKELDEGVRPIPMGRLFILKNWDPDTIARGGGVYVAGKVFYRSGEGALHHLTESMLNRYWDLKYSTFQRLGHPDWRYNCADYALSDDGMTSIADEDTYLTTNFNKVLDLAGKSAQDVQQTLETADGTYVCQAGAWNHHYFRVIVKGANATVMQKDGDSAVYGKAMTVQQAAQYCLLRAPQALYRHK